MASQPATSEVRSILLSSAHPKFELLAKIGLSAHHYSNFVDYNSFMDDWAQQFLTQPRIAYVEFVIHSHREKPELSFPR